jgi:hypothetical protein
MCWGGTTHEHPEGFVAAFITCGPKYYVRRLAERFARQHG